MNKTILAMSAVAALGAAGCESSQPDNSRAAEEARVADLAPVNTTPEKTAKAALTPEEVAMFTTRLQCGDTLVIFALTENDMADMRIANTSYAMRSVASASGAKYENLGNPQTSFLNQGNSAVVTIDNKPLPDCEMLPAEAAQRERPYVARGNEPGWNLAIENGMVALTADYGELRLNLPVSDDRRSTTERTVVARDGADRLELTVRHTPCADTMSGEQFADQVTVMFNDRSLTGCGGPNRLRDVTWRLKDMDGSGIVERAQLTLVLDQQLNIRGNAGCNRFRGNYSLEGEMLAINPAIAATKMGCATDALMQQESRYLTLLPAMTSITINDAGELVLSSDANQRLVFRAEDNQ